MNILRWQIQNQISKLAQFRYRPKAKLHGLKIAFSLLLLNAATGAFAQEDTSSDQKPEPDESQQVAEAIQEDSSSTADEEEPSTEEEELVDDEEGSRRFVPTEEISQDLGVSFPQDI